MNPLSATQPPPEIVPPAKAGTFDPRQLGKAGMLEVMRLASGATYQQLGRKLGMPPAKVRKFLSGDYTRPPEATVARLLSALWEIVPDHPRRRGAIPPYAFLTVAEAAQAVSVGRSSIRRLAAREPALGAIRVGHHIRIPREGLLRFFLGGPESRQSRFWTRRELAEMLRIGEGVLRYADAKGQIRLRRARWEKVRIPEREVRRILAHGLSPIKPKSCDLPGYTKRRRAVAAARTARRKAA